MKAILGDCSGFNKHFFMTKTCYKPLVLLLYLMSEHMTLETSDPRKLFFSFQNYVDIYMRKKMDRG